jgi:hypothetical protein
MVTVWSSRYVAAKEWWAYARLPTSAAAATSRTTRRRLIVVPPDRTST